MIDIIDMHIDETLTTQEQAAQEMKKTRKHQKLKKILLQRANTNHVVVTMTIMYNYIYIIILIIN